MIRRSFGSSFFIGFFSYSQTIYATAGYIIWEKDHHRRKNDHFTGSGACKTGICAAVY